MNDASGTRTQKSGGTARAQERHGDVPGERENPMVAALKHAPSRLEQRLEDGRGRERPASTGPRRPIHHRVPHKKHHGAMIAW